MFTISDIDTLAPKALTNAQAALAIRSYLIALPHLYESASRADNDGDGILLEELGHTIDELRVKAVETVEIYAKGPQQLFYNNRKMQEFVKGMFEDVQTKTAEHGAAKVVDALFADLKY